MYDLTGDLNWVPFLNVGDSGGPAVAYNASADDVYLVGIVSYAMSKCF